LLLNFLFLNFVYTRDNRHLLLGTIIFNLPGKVRDFSYLENNSFNWKGAVAAGPAAGGKT